MSFFFVVSYRNSTSNHNGVPFHSYWVQVVSYRNSTSNHNLTCDMSAKSIVVSYRNSTSNHNVGEIRFDAQPLYLIEIPHQTTTLLPSSEISVGCILSKFHIKPQHFADVHAFASCCILSKFHIKPQQKAVALPAMVCCILSKFHIKPQLPAL